MKQKKSLAAILISLMIATISFQATFSLFSSGAHNNTNVFASASQFPSTSVSPTITQSETTTPTPTPTPQLGDVVINEINWGGSNGDGSGNDEWIELRNTTDHSINISGWVVDNLGTGSGPGANLVIPSGTLSASDSGTNSYFIVSALSKSSSKINVDPDFVKSSLSLNNGGEQLTLRTSTVSGTIIDIANGIGAWLKGSNSTPKKSMERKNPPGDGTLSANWQDASTHTGMDATGPTDEFGTPKNENGL